MRSSVCRTPSRPVADEPTASLALAVVAPAAPLLRRSGAALTLGPRRGPRRLAALEGVPAQSRIVFRGGAVIAR